MAGKKDPWHLHLRLQCLIPIPSQPDEPNRFAGVDLDHFNQKLHGVIVDGKKTCTTWDV